MTELLTAAQMRAIEAAAIASGEVTGLELMERAGRGVVEAIFEEWPELRATSHRAVVLCGPGGNGGDGFVVARLLREWGWEVEVFLYGDPEKMPPDARVNYERWVGMGEVTSFATEPDAEEVVRHIASHDDQILVDALFGIGLSRPLDGAPARLLRWLDDTLDESIGWYVAVDVPSGVCADSGKPLGKWPRRADLTVAFHRAKPGHYFAEGPYFCGRLVVCDIGLRCLITPVGERTSLVATVSPMLGKKRIDAHKYSHGHALILSGPSGRGGAARLAARGALRIGAGVVTVGCPPEAIPENAARLDAVMLRGVADAEDLNWALEDKRVNAFCLGPGMIENFHSGAAAYDRVRSFLNAILKSKKSVVVDASALTAYHYVNASIFGKHAPEDLFSMLHSDCVLTPHAGEFAGLFPDIAEKLVAPATKGPAYSKVDATREAAKRAGCVVLYKGPDTVIADPTGRCAINSAHYDRAAPWLATAGSGDVLAGFITGLLARGFSPFDAACKRLAACGMRAVLRAWTDRRGPARRVAQGVSGARVVKLLYNVGRLPTLRWLAPVACGQISHLTGTAS